MNPGPGADLKLSPNCTALLGGKARTITVPNRSDVRGCLIPFEFSILPFVPQRVFIVQDVPAGTRRGGHAHGSQQQVLFCLSGTVAVELRFGGKEETVVLADRTTALVVDAGVWSAQRFIDPGSRLCVFASGPYDPSGYVETTG